MSSSIAFSSNCVNGFVSLKSISYALRLSCDTGFKAKQQELKDCLKFNWSMRCFCHESFLALKVCVTSQDSFIHNLRHCRKITNSMHFLAKVMYYYINYLWSSFFSKNICSSGDLMVVFVIICLRVADKKRVRL